MPDARHSDPRARHVRLTDTNGLAVQDDLKMGVALLICPRAAFS